MDVGVVVGLLEKAVGSGGAVVWSEDPFRTDFNGLVPEDEGRKYRKASEKFFKAYRTPEELAKAPLKNSE